MENNGDRARFEAINSYKDLVDYMVGVIQGRNLSPIYLFHKFDSQDPNTDNDWWHEDDPRYQLLYEINTLGLVTLNAQEGLLVGEKSAKADSSRNCLIFLCPRHLENKITSYLRRKKHVVFRRVKGRKCRSPRQFPVDTLPHSKHRYIEYMVNADGKYEECGLTFTYLDQFCEWWGEQKGKQAKLNMVELSVYDRKWDHPVYCQRGVFYDIASFLRRHKDSVFK